MTVRKTYAILAAAALFGAGFLCAWVFPRGNMEPSRLSTPRPDRAEHPRAPAQPDRLTTDEVSQLMSTRPSDISIGDFYVAVEKLDDAGRLAMLSHIDEMPPCMEKMMFRGLLIFAWSQHSPSTLVAYAEKAPKGQERDQMIFMGLGQWAKKDPARVLAWIGEKEQGGAYASKLDQYRTSLVNGWASTSPADALAYVRSLPANTPHERSMMADRMGAVVGQMANAGDIAGALALVESADDKTQRDRMRSALIWPWSSMAPAAAVQWASQVEADERAGPLNNAFNNWARKDSAAALQWADALPEADTSRARLLEQAAREYARADVDAAGAWLDAQPPSAGRDATLKGFVDAAANEDPAGAIVWAQTASTPEAAAQLQRAVMEKWIRIDPASARAYLDAPNAFTPDEAAQFRKELEKSAQ